MDQRRAAGALLALAVCIASSAAAPAANDQTGLDLYDSSSEGCYYNFQHYGEGDRIMTNEPCLNCTCHNRMLMCYLRVCPFTKPIGQDCTVEKRADQCCPIVTCPDVPVDLLTSTTTSPAEYGATGVGKLDKYGCSINGKYFPEGSKVPPSPNKPCEHCYCIRNMTTCVMQECTLHVDGCTPIYHKDVCCPVRYSCDHPEDETLLLDDMTTTVRPTPGFLLTTTTLSPVTQVSQDCVHDDQIFPDGALIKTEKACEHCYCMKGDIVCVVQECGTPMENEGKNCTSQPPREGQCCPDTYICEGDELISETSLDFTTQSVGTEELTTLSPPRRVGVEGSGYRNEPDEPIYTEAPSLETEAEGSGYEQSSEAPTDSTEKPIVDSSELTEPQHTTVKSPILHDIEKTTEPDKGLNTVPSDDEEYEPSILEKTTSSPAETETKITSGGVDKQESHEQETSLTEEATTTGLSQVDERTSTTESAFKNEDDLGKPTEIYSHPVEEVTTQRIGSEEVTTSSEDITTSLETKAPFIEELEEQTTSFTELTEKDVDKIVTPEEHTTESILQAITSAVTDLFSTPEVSESEEPSKMETTTKAAEEIDIPESQEENEIEDISTTLRPGRIPGEGDCLLNDVTYRNNSDVPSSNVCHTTCKCVSSIIKCDPIICSPPPEYMDNCQPTYDPPGSCCPTYICHTGETMPPQPHSQMSGTQSPVQTPSNECKDENCQASSDKEQPSEKPVVSECTSAECLQPHTTIPEEPTENCDDGKCQPPTQQCTDGDCHLTPVEEPVIVPVEEVPLCGNEKECKKPNIPSCEGKDCNNVNLPCSGAECANENILPTVESGQDLCTNEEDCQRIKPETPPCEGEACKDIHVACTGNDCSADVSKPSIKPTEIQKPCEGDCQISVDETNMPCTETSCRRKETSDVESPSPAECTGADCIQQTPTGEDHEVEFSTEMPTIDKKQDEQETTIVQDNQTVMPVTGTKPEGTQSSEDIVTTSPTPHVLGASDVTPHASESTEDKMHDSKPTEQFESTTETEYTPSVESKLPNEEPSVSTKEPEIASTQESIVETVRPQEYITDIPEIDAQETDLPESPVTESQDTSTKSVSEESVQPDEPLVTSLPDTSQSEEPQKIENSSELPDQYVTVKDHTISPIAITEDIISMSTTTPEQELVKVTEPPLPVETEKETKVSDSTVTTTFSEAASSTKMPPYEEDISSSPHSLFTEETGVTESDKVVPVVTESDDHMVSVTESNDIVDKTHKTPVSDTESSVISELGFTTSELEETEKSTQPSYEIKPTYAPETKITEIYEGTSPKESDQTESTVPNIPAVITEEVLSSTASPAYEENEETTTSAKMTETSVPIATDKTDQVQETTQSLTEKEGTESPVTGEQDLKPLSPSEQPETNEIDEETEKETDLKVSRPDDTVTEITESSIPKLPVSEVDSKLVTSETPIDSDVSVTEEQDISTEEPVVILHEESPGAEKIPVEPVLPTQTEQTQSAQTEVTTAVYDMSSEAQTTLSDKKDFTEGGQTEHPQHKDIDRTEAPEIVTQDYISEVSEYNTQSPEIYTELPDKKPTETSEESTLSKTESTEITNVHKIKEHMTTESPVAFTTDKSDISDKPDEEQIQTTKPSPTTIDKDQESTEETVTLGIKIKDDEGESETEAPQKMITVSESQETTSALLLEEDKQPTTESQETDDVSSATNIPESHIKEPTSYDFETSGMTSSKPEEESETESSQKLSTELSHVHTTEEIFTMRDEITAQTQDASTEKSITDKLEKEITPQYVETTEKTQDVSVQKEPEKPSADLTTVKEISHEPTTEYQGSKDTVTTESSYVRKTDSPHDILIETSETSIETQDKDATDKTDDVTTVTKDSSDLLEESFTKPTPVLQESSTITQQDIEISSPDKFTDAPGKEETSSKDKTLTTQFEDVYKTTEIVALEEVTQTPVDTETKQPDVLEINTNPTIEEQSTASPVDQEPSLPDLVELEEHSHKPVEEVTTDSSVKEDELTLEVTTEREFSEDKLTTSFDEVPKITISDLPALSTSPPRNLTDEASSEKPIERLGDDIDKELTQTIDSTPELDRSPVPVTDIPDQRVTESEASEDTTAFVEYITLTPTTESTKKPEYIEEEVEPMKGPEEKEPENPTEKPEEEPVVSIDDKTTSEAFDETTNEPELPTEKPDNELSFEKSTEVPEKKPVDEKPLQESVELPTESPMIEKESPEDKPMDSTEKAGDEPSETSEAKPHEKPSEKPVDEPTGKPEKEPTKHSEEKPVEEYSEKPSEGSSKKPMVEPSVPITEIPEEEASVKPADEITEHPENVTEELPADVPEKYATEKPVEESVDTTTETLGESVEAEPKPEDKPSDETTDKPEQVFVEAPIEKPMDQPAEKPIEKPDDKLADESTALPEEITEKPLENPEDKPSGIPTEKPDEKPVEEPTDIIKHSQGEPTEPSEKKPSHATTEKQEEPLVTESSEKPEVQSTEESSEKPDINHTDMLTVEPDVKPTQETTDKIEEKPEEKPEIEPSEKPDEASVDKPAEKPIEETNEEVEQKPLENIDREPEEKPLIEPADKVTEKPDMTTEEVHHEKPQDIPVEIASPSIPETTKPGISDVQPTDEIPDDDHFPPSAGTSGYGTEPDYVEEDQAFGPGTCRYGGKVYVSAQQIPRDDPCDFCFCFRSDIICLQQSCPPPIHGCHEEPIQGFCCPRYECPVAMATTLNITTTTTTTTTTLPPHFPSHVYKGAAERRGCQIKGHIYKVGEVVRASSGPCLHCTCGGDGQMKCDPKACTPEPMLRQMIAAAVSSKRRR